MSYIMEVCKLAIRNVYCIFQQCYISQLSELSDTITSIVFVCVCTCVNFSWQTDNYPLFRIPILCLKGFTSSKICCQ